jgi:hypothetical protein
MAVPGKGVVGEAGSIQPSAVRLHVLTTPSLTDAHHIIAGCNTSTNRAASRQRSRSEGAVWFSERDKIGLAEDLPNRSSGAGQGLSGRNSAL